MSRWLACFLILLACSTKNGNVGNTGSPDAPGQGTSSDGVTISAVNAYLVGSDGNVPPPTQTENVLLAIDITVTNAGTKPGFFAGLDPASFSVETTSGSAFAASQVTAELANACIAAHSVGPNAHATCTTVFEVPSMLTVAQLIYTLPDGSTATTAVSLSVPTTSGSSLGASCANASCPSPLVCVPGAHTLTCEATCTAGSGTSCEPYYSGSGTLSCFVGSNSGFCVVECIPGTDQCPGILVCSAGSGESLGICDAP